MSKIDTFIMPNPTDKDLNLRKLCAFCGGGASAFVRPFRQGDDWVYASDTSILVRMPAHMLPDEIDQGKESPPNTESVFNNEVLKNTDWMVNIRKKTATNHVICKLCIGAGKLNDPNTIVECGECDNGMTECAHCGAKGACEECGGRGVVFKSKQCPLCKDGKMQSLILAGNASYDPYYPYLVQNTFGPAEWGRSGDDLLVFRVNDDISGCVMRLTKEGK